MFQIALDALDPGGIPGAIGLMVLGATTPFPAEVAALAVAMNHRFWPALALIWTGAMAGATLSYALSDWICRRLPWIGRAGPVRAAQARLRDIGWRGVLGLRLIPLVPFFALGLAAGMLRVRAGDYLAGTALGILPASVILAMLGRGLISERAGVVAAGVLALAAIAGLALLLRRRAAARGALPGPGACPRTGGTDPSRSPP